MQSFLEQTLKSIIAQGVNLSEAIFVLPSQRACVFLKQIWVENSQGAGFLPKMIPIERFIEELSGLHQIERLPLIFQAYEIYKTQVKNPAPFDQFSNWATTAIQDFNEIDRHLVPAQELFSYLSDIKRLEAWDIENETDLVKNHFDFMLQLSQLYSALKEVLFEKGLGYQGLIYREAAQQIDSFCSFRDKNTVFLLGFNALNKAEEQIFQELLASGVGQVFWDGDAFYMEDNHIAGAFLRKYKAEWPYYQNNAFPEFENRFANREKEIISIAAPKQVSQTKYLGELLIEELSEQRTAVVLADENLLGLTLNGLPESVEKLNVTMGYPMRNIPLSSLFESLFFCYRNAKRLKLAEGLFYYKDVMAVLANTGISDLIEGDKLPQLQKHLNKENQLFLTYEDLSDYLPQRILAFFKSNSFETQSFLTDCLELIQELKQFKEGIELEYLFRFHKLFNQLQILNNKYAYLQGIELIHDFFKQLLSEESLSFQGEPLEGLQLMGMLETRSLDFEQLILLGVNEGILPTGKSENSFIPFDVKVQYDLPTFIQKDGIYAYHFFRLLQRSQKIYLTYNSETDGLGAGEQSRFITMLELAKLVTQKRIISPKVSQKSSDEFEVPKTDSVREKLSHFAQKGVSPSSLNTYINNPPQFYFEKLLKIYQADQLEEQLALNTLGTIIHDTLEDLYKPFVSKVIQVSDIQKMEKILEEVLVSKFDHYFRKGNYSTGKNLLTYEVAKTYVKSFLKVEKRDLESGAEISIISLEKELKTEIVLEGFHSPILLKGIADRIDRRNGKIRIIDYKTGRVKSSDLKCLDFEKITETTDGKYVLQVLFYTHLYKSNYPNTPLEDIEAGIISFKNFKEGFMRLNFSDKRGKKDSEITTERYEAFSETLEELLVEIFVSQKGFITNPEKKYAWI